MPVEKTTAASSARSLSLGDRTNMLPACSHWLSPEGEKRLDLARRETLAEVAQQLAAQALRVLAVARRRTRAARAPRAR
jgi:magnesium-transporting ATPase (P-type)